MEVIDKVKGESLDFVYVDGDHTLRGITKKVKPGSYVAGDDLVPNIWQHSTTFEPALVFAFALYFAEAVHTHLYSLPYNQFLIEEPAGAGDGYYFTDLTGIYTNLSVREQLASNSFWQRTRDASVRTTKRAKMTRYVRAANPGIRRPFSQLDPLLMGRLSINTRRLLLCALLLFGTSVLRAQKSLAVPTLPHGITVDARGNYSGTVIDTTYKLPTGGTTWAVHTAAQLTKAVASSAPGDVIVLDAGTTYTGNWQLPAKSNPSNKWIYIISSALNNLPEHTRVSSTSVANMPMLISPNAQPVLQVNSGSGYWRFAGLEVVAGSSYRPNPNGNGYSYYLIGTPWPVTVQPSNFTVDRCYVHGSPTQDIVTAVQVNANSWAVIDSYISDVHTQGQDNQAIGGSVTVGPIKVVNNYLEAAGENILIGGSGKNKNPGVPSDVEVRGNYLFKPLSWVSLSLPPINSMVAKNSFELKSAQRVLFDGNLVENCWAAGQVGYAVVLTVRSSQSGDFSVVNDVTVTNNILKNVVSFVNTLANDDVCGTTSYPDCHIAGSQDRWNISNNLVTFYDPTIQGGAINVGIGFKRGLDRPNGGVLGNMRDVVFQHNTLVSSPSKPCYSAVNFSPGTERFPPVTHITDRIWILDNVLCSQPNGDFGLPGTKGLNYYMQYPNTPPYDVTQRFFGNVMWSQGGTVYTWPTGNTVASVIAYVNPGTDWTLTTPNWTKTSDGTLAGINDTVLRAHLH